MNTASTATSSLFLDRLRQHADCNASKTAFRFLGDGYEVSDTLSFGEVWDISGRFARQLKSATAPGSRALLCFQPGLDFVLAFLGCLRARVIAVPAYLPHPRRDDPRLRAILDDCTASILIASETTLQKRRGAFDQTIDELDVKRIPFDRAELGPPSDQETNFADSDAIAFLQYTSGSTGTPKGVCVTHSNLSANASIIQQAFAMDERSIVVSWLPTHHDMGLVGDTLETLFCGGTSIKMPPSVFLRDPISWLEAISTYQATIAGAPNFAFGLCAERSGDERCKKLSFAHWEVAYCGAEPIQAKSMGDFYAGFRDAGLSLQSLFPCYGMAEATLFVSGGPRGRGPRFRHQNLRPAGINDAVNSSGHNHPFVGSGTPGTGLKVRVCDSNSKAVLPNGETGEIYVSGDNIAPGYWQKKSLQPNDHRVEMADGQRMMPTGDLGFLIDGELYVTGRLKDLIVVRGRKIYPQDVEQCTRDAIGLPEAFRVAAFETPVNSGKYSIALETPRHLDTAQLDHWKQIINAKVSSNFGACPETIIEVARGNIPVTTSGKIQRSECPRVFGAPKSPSQAFFKRQD